MNKKDRKKVVEWSLLENPNKETQVSDNSLKVILRVIIIALLLSLLVLGYSIKFSFGSYLQFFNVKLTGTINAENFYEVDNCDLIVVKPYENIADANIGDVVCYATSIEKGSGKIVNFRNDLFELQVNDEIKKISRNAIVGEQIKTRPVLGLFVQIIGSDYGLIVANIILIAYVAYITFSRINYENTSKGVYLYKKFRQEQKEERKRVKLLKSVNADDSVKVLEVINLLSGNFDENLQSLNNFNPVAKISLKDKYKYVLSEIHDSYLGKESLTKEEKKHITSLIELMCVPSDIDPDIEYMVVDLILKTGLVGFDYKNFNASAVKFLSSQLDDDDLLNFGSILYALVYNNKKYRKNLSEVAEVLLQKSQYLERKDRETVFGTALAIISLIKN